MLRSHAHALTHNDRNVRAVLTALSLLLLLCPDACCCCSKAVAQPGRCS